MRIDGVVDCLSCLQGHTSHTAGTMHLIYVKQSAPLRGRPLGHGPDCAPAAISGDPCCSHYLIRRPRRHLGGVGKTSFHGSDVSLPASIPLPPSYALIKINGAPISPFLLQRSAAARMRRFSLGENCRRFAVAAASGLGGGAMEDASVPWNPIRAP